MAYTMSILREGNQGYVEAGREKDDIRYTYRSIRYQFCGSSGMDILYRYHISNRRLGAALFRKERMGARLCSCEFYTMYQYKFKCANVIKNSCIRLFVTVKFDPLFRNGLYGIFPSRTFFHVQPHQNSRHPAPTPGHVLQTSVTMSKQYLTTHTIDDAHITDIFSLAVTPTQILSASGASSIKIYSTTTPSNPLAQTLTGAHKLGCHHICTSRNGRVAASVGFGGEVKIWSISPDTSEWVQHGSITDENKAGEVWAIALSEDGQFLASTTYDGRINVWDLKVGKIREYETKGSFGMCIDMSRDGRFTASGHENGAVYVFNNDTGRMLYSLPGLVKPIRTVAFSPAGTRLAAAGDARVIALYDVQHGEQVANMNGHSAWIFSVDWSDTGEYLLSGSFDGKVKVWSIDQRTCVATHSETDKTLWSVKWLPKTGRSEAFATAGANRSISFYREATGG